MPEDTGSTSRERLAEKPERGESISGGAQDPWNQQYHRGYYLEHREYERLTAPELERIRKEPTLAREVRYESIACLECGLLLTWLHVHLNDEHQLTSKAYRLKWKLRHSFPLCSKAFSDKMRAKRGKDLDVAGTQTRFQKAQGDLSQTISGRDARRPKKAWQPPEPKASDWDIAKLRLRGAPQAKIADSLRLTQGAVSARLLKMGFPKSYKNTGLILFHGAPLTREHLPALIRDWIALKHADLQEPATYTIEAHEQFTLEEAARRLGVSPSWVRERTRGRARLQVGARRGRRIYLGNAQVQFLRVELGRIRARHVEARARREIAEALAVKEGAKTSGAWLVNRLRANDRSAPLSREMAGRVLTLWKQLKAEWRKRPASQKGGRPKKLLPSEETALPRRYHHLQKDLKDLLKWLKNQDSRVSQRDLMDRTCSQAKRGQLRSLLFCPEFFVWLKKGFDPRTGEGMDWPTFLLQRPKLSEGDWRPNEVALDFLAHDYGVAATTLKDLLKRHPNAK